MKNTITIVIAIVLLAFAIFQIVSAGLLHGIAPLFVSICLFILSFFPGRGTNILIGHLFIVLGCFLVTWGLYLLPHCEPKLAYILLRPLFWGFISIFGGICAIYHGFCNCVVAHSKKRENA